MNKANNYCIIMAGGTGIRFWPIASPSRPKQFLDIMGSGESMLQTTFRRMERVCPRENIIIVSSRADIETVHRQIPELADYQVLGEPIRRGTAPCIAYAAAVIAGRCPSANIIVTPSDHAIFGIDRYVEDINQAIDIAEHNDWIITVGVQPTNPNTKYGYIQYSEEPSLPTAHNLHPVVTFTEKPPIEMARKFIMSGEFMWNAGILVWRNDILKKAFCKFLPGVANLFFGNDDTGQQGLSDRSTPDDVERTYSVCESISTDFGILEKAENVHVMAASFGWSDVETWDSLHETCGKDSNGNVVIGGNVFTYDVHNTVIHMPDSDHTLVVQGLDGYIIAADEETMMICRRDQEEQIVKFRTDVAFDRIKSSKE
jgi:mannose-1-phosphate guanylyltransferase